MDVRDFPELHEVLRRLPWFRDLSRSHRTQMLTEVELVIAEATRDEFSTLLHRWSDVAHTDLKWSRFALLIESGLLDPRRR